MNISSWI